MSKKVCKTKDGATKTKIKNPKYECKVCHGLASKEKHLCKSKKI